jgi:hypothetical protein
VTNGRVCLWAGLKQFKSVTLDEIYKILYVDIVTHMAITKQRLDKHVPTHAVNNIGEVFSMYPRRDF